jgi:hypothetical protein
MRSDVDLDADRLSADYDRGVLVLTIPIAEESRLRRISVHQRELQEDGASSADADATRSAAQPATTS